MYPILVKGGANYRDLGVTTDAWSPSGIQSPTTINFSFEQCPLSTATLLAQAALSYPVVYVIHWPTELISLCWAGLTLFPMIFPKWLETSFRKANLTMPPSD